MDEKDFYIEETKNINHPGGWKQPVTMEKWYWETLHWIVNQMRVPLREIVEACEQHRGGYEFDYALRYYIQEYVACYERAAAS